MQPVEIFAPQKHLVLLISLLCFRELAVDVGENVGSFLMQRGVEVVQISETLTPQEAFDLVPADLWFDTLGMLIRMVPAIGPDSICRLRGINGGKSPPRVSANARRRSG